MHIDEEQSQQILQKLIIQEWKDPDIMSCKHKINKVIWATCLKLNIKKTKSMESGPITSWKIDGEKNGTSDRFYSF